MSDSMVKVAEFVVMGEPISKARARFTNQGSKTRTYTPERTKEGERIIRQAFMEVAPDHEPDAEFAYCVRAVFYHGTRQRRDVDNMMKLILDGLNKVAWADDTQVTAINATKVLATRENARTVVVIFRLDRLEKRVACCERCGKEFDWYPSQSKRRFCTLECWYTSTREARAKVCANCGKEFINKPHVKTCSRECGAALRRTTVTCSGCGVEFTKQRCHVRATNYCSVECHQRVNRERILSRTAGTCQTCGGPTSKKSYRQCNGCVRGVSGKPQPTKEITA